MINPSRRFWIAIGSIVAAGLVLVAWPLPSKFDQAPVARPLRLLDRRGEVLYDAYAPEGGNQSWLPYDRIPSQAIETLIATEDRAFWWHLGVSPRGILRSAWRNLSEGRIVGGGSTITQQLVRQYLQPERRDVPYKIREALLAIKLEARWSKKKILEEYLNLTFFGQQAYGLEAAANTYFGKPAHELSDAEIAMLIGLLKSPSTLNPFNNPLEAKWRQAEVLESLVATNRMSESERTSTYDQPLQWNIERTNIEAPHFVFWLLQHQEFAGKTEVQTTLDLGLQREIESIVQTQIARLEDKNVTSAAVVVLDAKQGDILAMVGSADYFDATIDGAVNATVAPRQPGSTLKPFTYALALEQGDTVATTVADSDYQLLTQEGNPYTPRNYDYELHGLVSYREALANSYNIPAVRTLERVGLPRLQSLLQAAGITTLTQSPEHYGLALTLGSGEIKLLELARAFALFPRSGRTLTLRAVADEAPSPSGEALLSPATAWLISDVLSDKEARVAEYGTDGVLNFDFPVAAKTGTTRNARDNWVIGYTPDLVVGVWVGNNDASPMKDTSGVTGAGPIFRDVVLAATKDLEKRPFERPTNIVEATVCLPSGKLPTPLCPRTTREVFAAGTVPTESDDIYQARDTDTRNGLLVGPGCPAEFVQKRVYTVFPPEVETWAQEHGWPVSPREYSPLCGSSAARPEDEWIQITSPGIGDAFRLDPLVPDEHERIILRATASLGVSRIRWFAGEELIGEGSAPDFRLSWQPQKGTTKIRAVSGEAEVEVGVEVE